MFNASLAASGNNSVVWEFLKEKRTILLLFSYSKVEKSYLELEQTIDSYLIAFNDVLKVKDREILFSKKLEREFKRWLYQSQKQQELLFWQRQENYEVFIVNDRIAIVRDKRNGFILLEQLEYNHLELRTLLNSVRFLIIACNYYRQSKKTIVSIEAVITENLGYLTVLFFDDLYLDSMGKVWASQIFIDFIAIADNNSALREGMIAINQTE